MRRRRVFRAKDVKSILFGHRHPTLALHVDRQSVEQPKKPSAAGPVRYRISRAESRSLRSECNYRMQTNVPLGLRTAGWPVCLRHQAWFWPPHIHLPVTLLRWPFGPQPPSAKAGVTAEDTATKRMAIPS